MDRHFISSLILGSTPYKLRFISSLILESVWQTGRHSISPLILGSVIQTDTLRFISPSNWNLHKAGRRTNYLPFRSSYWNPSKTDELSFISPIITGSKTNRRKNYVTLDSSYWNPSKMDRRTNCGSFPPSYWKLRKTNIRTNYVSFHPSYWNLSKTNYVSFHSCWDPRKKDRQTDKLHFISSLIVESNQDRQTK